MRLKARLTAAFLLVAWAVTVYLIVGTAFAQAPIQNVPTELRASQNCSEVRGTGAQTATLTPPAGQYVYIASLEANASASAGSVGISTPASLTTTNLAGVTFGMFGTNSGAAGTSIANNNYSFSGNGFKSSAAGTAVTVVAPSVTNMQWHLALCGYFAP
jgi:hypothetical protein